MVLDMMSDLSSDSDLGGREPVGGEEDKNPVGEEEGKEAAGGERLAEAAGSRRSGEALGVGREKGPTGSEDDDEGEDDDPVRAAAEPATADAAAALARPASRTLPAPTGRNGPSHGPCLGAPRGFLDGMSSSEDEGEEVCFGGGGVGTGQRPNGTKAGDNRKRSEPQCGQ
jgi:hypothetical protein